MNRLFIIASNLNDIARHRFALKQQIDIINRNIKTQEAAIIPAGGWPGSNADTRKAAEVAAKAADELLRTLANDKATTEEAIERLELDRDALLAERDAWQWTIRDRETMAHEGGLKTSVFEDYDAWQDEVFQEGMAQAQEDLLNGDEPGTSNGDPNNEDEADDEGVPF